MLYFSICVKEALNTFEFLIHTRSTSDNIQILETNEQNSLRHRQKKKLTPSNIEEF